MKIKKSVHGKCCLVIISNRFIYSILLFTNYIVFNRTYLNIEFRLII